MAYKDPEKKKEWYRKNKARLLAKAAARYKENQDELKAKSKAHYHKHRDEIRTRTNELNRANPQRKKAWEAKYREKNREKKNQWAKDNRQIVNEWRRRGYKRAGEKIRAYNRSKNEGWEDAPARGQLWEIGDDAMIFDSRLSNKELSEMLERSVMAVSCRRAYLKKLYGDDLVGEDRS